MDGLDDVDMLDVPSPAAKTEAPGTPWSSKTTRTNAAGGLTPRTEFNGDDAFNFFDDGIWRPRKKPRSGEDEEKKEKKEKVAFDMKAAFLGQRAAVKDGRSRQTDGRLGRFLSMEAWGSAAE